ncbi:hypothetical protein PZA18_07615 [Chitinimonas sp. DQS-5]|uniref:Uncharacterized protein n=1 Tax=Parachitinimonas caeni TaxID=3031301 RepID=A0ABT7DV20_9NEIS|nr:hypothetical protein [Parachitinimonas caeni]
MANQPLTGHLIHKILSSFFPKRNDYAEDCFDELVPELMSWEIHTAGQFSKMMKRHRRQLRRLDRQKLPAWEIDHYSEMYGREWVRDALRRQYWFAYPALVRIALELEFGEAAEVWETE